VNNGNLRAIVDINIIHGWDHKSFSGSHLASISSLLYFKSLSSGSRADLACAQPPLHVTSSQLIASEVFPALVVKALLYPGAIVNGLVTNLTEAFAVTDLQRLEVLVGSYFSVAGAFVGALKPERMSMLGSLLVIWGLVKEGILGKPVNTDPSKSAYVYPTMVVAVIWAFSLVNYDVKKAVRSAPVRPIAKPLQSSSKSKLNCVVNVIYNFSDILCSTIRLFQLREEFLYGDPVWFRLVYNIETNQDLNY
ncbi:hypothetical protein SDJN02_07854, partial [Cucurbita argyrosperma subsp. argyrosperma]